MHKSSSATAARSPDVVAAFTREDLLPAGAKTLQQVTDVHYQRSGDVLFRPRPLTRSPAPKARPRSPWNTTRTCRSCSSAAASSRANQIAKSARLRRLHRRRAASIDHPSANSEPAPARRAQVAGIVVGTLRVPSLRGCSQAARCNLSRKHSHRVPLAHLDEQGNGAESH